MKHSQFLSTMASDQVIEESREIRREALALLKDSYKNSHDKDFVKLNFGLCGNYIQVISDMLENDCKSGPQKSSCFYTLNQLIYIRETLFSLANVTGGSVTPHVRWLEIENVFKNRIIVGMIKNYGFLDLEKFLDACKDTFCEQFGGIKNPIKVYTTLDALFALAKSDEVLEENKSFNTKVFEIYPFSNLQELFNEHIKDKLIKNVEEFQERDSGWVLRGINYLTVNVFKHNPLRAGKYIDLPDPIKNKKACINVKNEDEMCFKWAVLCGLYHEKQRDEENNKIPKIPNSNRVSKYIPFEEEMNLDFSGINFPTSPCEFEKFERQNNISINLYAVEKNEKDFKIIVAQPSKICKKKGRKHLNLLMLQKVEEYYESKSDSACLDLENKNITKKRKVSVLKSNYNHHYLYIKSVERLVGKQISKRTKFFCDICFHYFHKKDNLEQHEEKCREKNECEVVLPDENNTEERFVKFKNFGNKISVPFTIYADFESLLKPVDGNPRQEIIHEPLSVGYHLKCR